MYLSTVIGIRYLLIMYLIAVIVLLPNVIDV